MTIRLHAISVHARPGVTAGSIALHDDTTGRTVKVRVLDTNIPPGYRIVAENTDTDVPNWPAFLAAFRYSAVLDSINGFPLARFSDRDIERLLWRYIRGETDTDSLRTELDRLDHLAAEQEAATTTRNSMLATETTPDNPDTSEGEHP